MLRYLAIGGQPVGVDVPNRFCTVLEFCLIAVPSDRTASVAIDAYHGVFSSL